MKFTLVFYVLTFHSFIEGHQGPIPTCWTSSVRSWTLSPSCSRPTTTTASHSTTPTSWCGSATRWLPCVTSQFQTKRFPYKALFTRDILTHNIAIKRYCDKKTFFIQFFLLSDLKIFIFGQFCSTDVSGYYNLYGKSSLMTTVWKDFEMQLQYFDKKMSLYCNIFLSFYRNIVCRNVSCE
jgi:hypothetical protein